MLRPDDREREEAKAIIEQARWLHGIHAKRVESAQTRAIALLGFDGVLVTLVAKLLADTRDKVGLVGVAVGLALTIISMALALAAIMPRKFVLPGTSELRATWKRYWPDPKSAPSPTIQIAEDLTRSSQPNEPAVSDSVKADADHRVRLLEWSAVAFAVAVFMLGGVLLSNAI